MSQLKDVVVLEFASVLAGPGVGQFFAELGARVIKVENVKTFGDVTRSWKSARENTDDRSAYFSSVNWGKQSIALDLSRSEGQEIARRLAQRADIVIASFKPGDAEKLGVDYPTLNRENPGLIYGHITGYGRHSARVGYDAIVQAESGFMYMNGEPGGRSLKMPVALVDILAGHQLKEGILLAMLEKARTGKGTLVEVSLIEAAVASLANQAANYLVGKAVPAKQGSQHPNIAPYGDVFITADGKEILLAVGTDRQFTHLCNILKISNISKDLAFQTNASRVRNRDRLNALLATQISGLTAAELMPLLQASHVPAGAIRNLEEVFQEPEIQNVILSSGDFKGVRTFVCRRDGMPQDSHLLPPPHFGEHSRQILHELLKFSPTTVDSLVDRGVIRD